MKKIVNKNDLRVRRTKKLLEDSLISLLRKKSFEGIKVTDICDKAMIHRSTFYVYYNDKYELLKSKLDEYESELVSELRKYKMENKLRSSYKDIIIKILTYFYNRKKQFRVILNNNENGVVLKILYNYVFSYIAEGLRGEKSINPEKPVPINVMADFYSGAFLAVILNWIKNNCEVSVEDLAEYCYIIISK